MNEWATKYTGKTSYGNRVVVQEFGESLEYRVVQISSRDNGSEIHVANHYAPGLALEHLREIGFDFDSLFRSRHE